MKRLLYYIISLLDENWGYGTPIQKRFKVGDKVVIAHHLKNAKPEDLPIGRSCTIIETGRHDYLIEGVCGRKQIVYQFEIEKQFIPKNKK